MSSKDASVGLYLHIPFCIRKCLYCDFCSFPGCDAETVQSYADAMCRELQTAAPLCRDRTVDTVYFGGGTPTLLPVSVFVRILETVYRFYRVSGDAEITTECNPATGDTAYFGTLHSVGVNRLSIGVQSIHENELCALGRVHTAEDFYRTYTHARRAGFDNVGVDLMFGIPEQTKKSFDATLRRVTDLYPEHLSVYGLIVEEGTPFFDRAATLPVPDEETEREMYMHAVSMLSGRGYERYEISNFARGNRISRHNYRYWDAAEYLGFGVAAHSYFDGVRFSHSRDLAGYLKGADITDARESIDTVTAADEYVMLRMRLARGIDGDEFERRFGLPFSEYAKRLDRYVPAGLVGKEGHRYFFTSDGFYVSNAVLSDILEL